MKKILYAITLLAITAIVIAKLMSNKKTAEAKIYHYNKEQPILVLADTVHLTKEDIKKSYTGNFDAFMDSKISSELQGKINTIEVHEGSYVQKWQPVVQLDNALLQLQLQTVEVQIKGLEDDAKRYGILSNADAIQGIQLEKVQLALQSAKIQRNTLLEQIAKTTIRAPFNGIVTMKFNEIGAFAAPGMPLLQITDLSRLKFTINVPENDLPFFKTNNTYPIQADIFPELNLSGKVTLIGSKSGVGNLYPVQFTLNNTPDFKIKAGMFGKVYINNAFPQPAIVIPGNAVVGSDIQPQVYVVKNGKVVLQNIVIASRNNNQIIVANGLIPGDIVITSGLINLYEGANVSIHH
ncbi:MAG: efflux RND transporter periplasmic adaptor subunit [Hydrotalea flava]|uniref:efflux RND transporter periplasmic adaptor subunit n=1 Tax=Hydrotalea TaxID=1004300 RepID=UPI0009449B67|nr:MULTISPECIES: efflux RND transporter periplasmic adaptor subunit [Hydrotalea]MBY0349040.1 efflux RND transporter periplasmic adaptor subunit [Hydrotalea flava]NIM36546.1 efflux RND transporter periplasmic adaptor subunit [Hydrotalea flava]NIM39405.1 efflux RND transporter periplasmic adaptor subunit [Hydrotalea flava]NIN04594.1 efflux RND transporter periplasmic adaptor subunit [Hydrotalea flava]NIN16266.1 efflux RND transporter periplasmic adaptor subunit [Hydrotalea flava]